MTKDKPTMKKYFVGLILFLTIFTAPEFAMARKAETMIVPTRIVIENGQKFFSMIIKNNGDATGQYTIDTIDMEMKEDGSIVEVPAGTPAPYSAAPFVHMSPRSVTLPLEKIRQFAFF